MDRVLALELLRFGVVGRGLVAVHGRPWGIPFDQQVGGSGVSEGRWVVVWAVGWLLGGFGGDGAAGGWDGGVAVAGGGGEGD